MLFFLYLYVFSIGFGNPTVPILQVLNPVLQYGSGGTYIFMHFLPSKWVQARG